jgi:choline-glycine betaine transporter
MVKQTCYLPNKLFKQWEDWVTVTFTWLYIFTQDVWIVFLIVLYFSKYSSLKLGRETDRPEFGDFSWFAMIFSCGVATGLFFYGATEPVYYYQHQQDASSHGWGPQNRWSYLPDNKRAQNAMNTTWYHWGLHGWVCYTIVGALLAFLHYRKGLPMTVKTCFYPLLGTSVYGFLGDFLDIISTVTTTIGVCTSLGLGVMQLDAGISMLGQGKNWLPGVEDFYGAENWDSWKGQEKDLKEIWNSWPVARKVATPWYTCTDGTVHENYEGIASVANIVNENTQHIVLIWIVTAAATCSVMLGLHSGIQVLASICMLIGMFIIFYIWMMDDTWFISNLIVQSLGYYIQWLFELGFHTSAWSHSEHGDSSATDWPNGNPGGESKDFMKFWTIFYWGWWIAWAPFVGVFLARISRGRTLKNFIAGALFLPSAYNLLFIGVLGGAGLKMQMLAEKYGISCSMPTAEHVQTEGGSLYANMMMKYGRNICREVPGETNIYTGEKELFCSTVFNLGCIMQNVDYPSALFALMSQYSDMGRFMIVMTMIALFLYFIASSDSGSYVDDMVTANGIPEPPLVQRFFWAFTEGAAATALLYTGRFLGKADDALKTLRSLSLCVGLPYTFLICFMCLALWRAVQYEMEDRMWNDGWQSKIMDVGIEIYRARPSLNEDGQAIRCLNLGCGKLRVKRLCKTIVNVFCPIQGLWPVTHKIEARKAERGSHCKAKLVTLSCMVLFYGWLACLGCEWIPEDTTPWEWGGSFSGTQNGVTMSKNTTYFQSKRYGYYKEWSTDPRHDNGVVKYRTSYDAQAGETLSMGWHVPPGPRAVHSRRFATIGWFLFFTFATALTYIRGQLRAVCGIPGGIFEDFLCANFWAPCLVQMAEQADIGEGDKSGEEVILNDEIKCDSI